MFNFINLTTNASELDLSLKLLLLCNVVTYFKLMKKYEIVNKSSKQILASQNDNMT